MREKVTAGGFAGVCMCVCLCVYMRSADSLPGAGLVLAVAVERAT